MSDKIDETKSSARRMSDKVDETISSARRMSQEVGESIHERTDDLSKVIHEQQKNIDDFVYEKPYMAMGIGFLAGLILGAVLCGHKRRCRD
ncbi:MAG: hypothetical protein QG670_412 [Thermoproteota archaeon]|nr:hypothetical protein [Thermoproteota archaeon]